MYFNYGMKKIGQTSNVMGDKRLYITIDTEMDADFHWQKKFPASFTSVVKGIPLFYRPLWDEYNVHPIYFVSPEILYDENCCNILREEISKGAIIGAHLHGEYIGHDSQYGNVLLSREVPFPCNSYDRVQEYEKIKRLKELIIEKLNVCPEWYRAERFGADIETLSILYELGFKYDSSETPGIDWSDMGGPNFKEISLSCETAHVKEIPITVCGKRFGLLGQFLPDNWLFYRWLRPTHMFWYELKKIVKEKSNEGSNLVMMFHSMEIMIGKTPYVRGKIMQLYFFYKLKKTIEMSIRKGYTV